MMMKSSSHESPKPHLLTLNLKNSTLNICQNMLKSANLLHKWGFGDSQSNCTILSVKNYSIIWSIGFQHIQLLQQLQGQVVVRIVLEMIYNSTDWPVIQRKTGGKG